MSTERTKQAFRLFAILLFCGLLPVRAQQPLMNLPGKQAPAPVPIPPSPSQVPVTTYAPKEPLANSDPGVLEPPALIARGINEDDATYTQRMQSVQLQLLQERDDLVRRHDEAMKRVARIGAAGNGTVPPSLPVVQQTSR